MRARYAVGRTAPGAGQAEAGLGDWEIVDKKQFGFP